ADSSHSLCSRAGGIADQRTLAAGALAGHVRPASTPNDIRLKVWLSASHRREAPITRAGHHRQVGVRQTFIRRMNSDARIEPVSQQISATHVARQSNDSAKRGFFLPMTPG